MSFALNLKTSSHIPASKGFGRFPPFPAGRKDGFTFGDLVAVLAMLSVVAIVFLPFLFRAGLIVQRQACVNDLHQIQNGWILYNNENNGNFPYNCTGNGSTNYNWVCNEENYSDNPWSTNATALVDPSRSQLAPYVPNYKLYKCPADQSCAGTNTSTTDGLAGPPRVRSYSMSTAVGPYTTGGITNASGAVVQGLWLDSDDEPEPPPNSPGDYTVFLRQSMVVGAMRPSGLIVLIDEHPDGINDGNWAFHMPEAEDTFWIDFPTPLHGNAGNFSFADGHCEIYAYKVLIAVPQVTYMQSVAVENQPVPENADIYWIAPHISAIYP